MPGTGRVEGLGERHLGRSLESGLRLVNSDTCGWCNTLPRLHQPQLTNLYHTTYANTTEIHQHSWFVPNRYMDRWFAGNIRSRGQLNATWTTLREEKVNSSNDESKMIKPLQVWNSKFGLLNFFLDSNFTLMNQLLPISVDWLPKIKYWLICTDDSISCSKLLTWNFSNH